MAECRGLAPHPLTMGDTLFSKQVWRLDRLTFQCETSPRGRDCTCTVGGLSFVPLPWATRGGAPGQGCTDTGRGLRPLPLPWATGAKKLVPREGFPPPTSPF